ncbi:zinc transporter [Pseudooceanicola antarcticus]|uniref:Zinc transporter n=1 Tax=Pseudooceanicola antarcticus TaxID=1247613 RepID=A0A285IR10_9RHOB|nr:zinc transporter ZntB [Pseudooceanicola antarcticus]PJE31658.1 zinc transporter ZntB [Pseudooceanicola antarcticus]SNY50137.1 zinc transporter [Pseudooceanicola antarcticus]
MTAPVHYAFALSGPLRCQPLQGQAISDTLRDQTLAWAHLDAAHAGTRDWVSERLSYLDTTVVEALTQPETRPRATPVGDGLLLNFRAMNLNPDCDREDMIGVRIWADSQRIITLSRQRVSVLDEIAREIEQGGGPETAGGFIALLADRLTEQLEPFVTELDGEVDALEPQVIQNRDPGLRRRIVSLRLSVVELRRHLPPQREAMTRLARLEHPLLEPRDLREVQEASEGLFRMAENVDELRDNLGVLRDELTGAVSERLTRHMYALSVLSAVFLPLTFFTGLFGINVGGIPGAHGPNAFWIFSGVMALIFLAQGWLLRRLHWL